MGLIYEDERYFSASDVNRFDAEKFDRFIDCLAHDIDRYTADAKILENGYGKYYHNTTYVGKAASASKEFIDRKQFDKFHVESKEVQKELFYKCTDIRDMFREQVDSSPKARIDSETLEFIKRDYRDYYDELEHEGYDIECMAREIENYYGKYGKEVAQPNYRRSMEVYDELCCHGGFMDKCIRKFENFNEDARQHMKRSMIKEHSYDLQKNMKATATALEGMTVFKTEVERQSIWVNALNASNVVVDPEKLATDIREIIKLSGIKYDKNAIIDANIVKNATDLALHNCKSKNEKVALLTCSDAMQGLLVDPMSIESFLEAFWIELVGIVTTVTGIIASANPVVLTVTLVLLLISAILLIAGSVKKSASKEQEAEKKAEAETESKAIPAGNSGNNNDDDDDKKGKKNDNADNNANQYDTKERIDNAKKIAKEVQDNNGKPPKGYQGGRTYKNFPKNPGDQKLPEGNTYKEYDVNPKQPGVNRGTERIVIGSDGSVWYTNDHYHTFFQLW